MGVVSIKVIVLSKPSIPSHFSKDPDPLMGTTQSRSPGRKVSRVTTLRVPREEVPAIQMSVIDVAAGVQLRSEGQPWLLAPIQEIRIVASCFS